MILDVEDLGGGGCSLPVCVTLLLCCLDSSNMPLGVCRIFQKQYIFGGSNTSVVTFFGESEQHSF